MSAEGGFLGHLPSSAFAVPTICTSSQESLSEKLRFIQKCYQRTTRGRKGMGRGAGRRSRVRGRAQVAGSGPRVRARVAGPSAQRRTHCRPKRTVFAAKPYVSGDNIPAAARQPPPCPARSPAAPDARTRHPRPGAAPITHERRRTPQGPTALASLRRILGAR